VSDDGYKNIVVFVSDALRYDYAVDHLPVENVVPTLAPSLHTPTSFASLFSARSPENHIVRDFFDSFEEDVDTAFDFYDNSGFWDGHNSSINDNILEAETKELSDMEEPFIWMERMMETHLIYGKMGHDRDYDYDKPGQVLYEQDRRGEIDVREKYKEGVEVMWKHFQRHIEDLEELGILEDTLVIITSDHGELLGERYLFKDRYDHNIPPLKQIVQVPTIFYNHDVDIDSMRLIDLFPTALSIANEDFEGFGDGVDVRKDQVETGRNIMRVMPGIAFDTKWSFDGDEWEPTRFSRLSRGIKTLGTDVGRFFFSRSDELEQKIEESTEDEEKEEEIKEKLENLGYMDD